MLSGMDPVCRLPFACGSSPVAHGRRVRSGMCAHTLKEWGDALVGAGWTVEREIDTLVTLARSGDAAVALRAIEALHGILREVCDPEIKQQLRQRLGHLPAGVCDQIGDPVQKTD